ncbi:MAG TPA: thiamine pyrophosphate-dependent enzyme [Chloroflexota bacterium]|nr:thiamine pyrophosphate-dependent enzyme [Chloroflexota bacterium]
MAMHFRACFELLARRRTDQLVVTSAGNTSSVWWEVTQDHEASFYMEASMSLVSMFSAGLALGVPGARVWAISGDGAFAMNPGMLMVERQLALPNVVHFLASNRCYGATGEVPLPNAPANDYAQVARGFGLQRVFAFDELDELGRCLDEIIGQPGPTFVVLELDPLGSPTREVPVEGPDLKYRFGRHIERTHGVKVFDH